MLNIRVKLLNDAAFHSNCITEICFVPVNAVKVLKLRRCGAGFEDGIGGKFDILGH